MKHINQNIITTPIGPEEIVAQTKMIELVRQKMQIGDIQKDFEFARRSPGTRLIIVSPEKKLLLTKEFRTEVNDFDYRLPGGKVFDTLDEYKKYFHDETQLLNKAKEGAKREAAEEAGIKILDLDHFWTSKCGTTIVWDLYYFVVSKYQELPKQENDWVGENISVAWYTFAEAKQLALSNKMQEDRSVAVLLKYLLKHNGS